MPTPPTLCPACARAGHHYELDCPGCRERLLDSTRGNPQGQAAMRQLIERWQRRARG